MLIDWAGWARKRDIPINFLEGSVIPLDHVKAIISEQKIELRPGDVLFIRSGFAGFLKTLSVEEQLNISQRSQPEYIGLESTKETLGWLWENRFSAVAGDMVGLETIGGSNTEYLLHQWLLAGWGMPIGELFDLEELAEHCAQEGRYTFYLSSVPLKVSRFSEGRLAKLLMICRCPEEWQVRQTLLQFCSVDMKEIITIKVPMVLNRVDEGREK